MAPIPSTFAQEIIDLLENLDRRRKDLLDFQIPRLRDCTGSLVTQQQYAAEVREDIEAFSRIVESLDLSVDDQKGERNRQQLRALVDDYTNTLGKLRREARTAVLTSKRAIDSNKQSNREELLRSSAVREKQDLNEKVTEDALMTTTNDVTEALQRTIGLMQGELERSVLSSQLLEASTASLKSASTTHDVLDNLMTTSKHLITALEKSDWLDRLLILAALCFFILVVLFILKQRLVDRSLRIALWWTRFIPSRRSSTADAMEKGTMIVSSMASSAVVSVTTALTSAITSSAAQSSVVNVTPSLTLALTTSFEPSVTSISSSDGLLQTELDGTGIESTISTSIAELPSEAPQPHDEL
ncbi:hypothetical protein QCA50_018664 [Cerrena zonata]|uniref:Sec20 C-terminal domain-containing protein n=1 Tax=Cerrena zonata TaxID=2478898 RepID=A0AAW0FLU5_9APHY